MIRQSREVFISFIIVAKNAPYTINRCIESVLSQDFDNFELIVVLDTHLDPTFPVAEQIAKSDTRVRILVRDVNTAFCQVGNARNYGIANSLGQWIWFVDSDDWVESETLFRIVRLLKLHEPDFLVCNVAYAFKDNGSLRIADPLKIEVKYANRLINSVELRGDKQHIFDGNILGEQFVPCWRAIISKSFLEMHNIKFQENVVNEDNIYAMSIWLLATRVFIYNNVAYFHYIGPSTGATTRHATAQQVFDVGQECSLFLEQFEGNPSYSSEFIDREKLRILLQRYHYAKNLKVEDRKLFLQLMNKAVKERNVLRLIDRYGDGGDVVFLDAILSEDPEKYQLYTGITDNINRLSGSIYHVDENVNRVIKTVNYVDDNVNRVSKTLNYVDDNVNKVLNKIADLDERINRISEIRDSVDHYAQGATKKIGNRGLGLGRFFSRVFRKLFRE
jgi:glycosyltransferase involved in cell wall biosynthesis